MAEDHGETADRMNAGSAGPPIEPTGVPAGPPIEPTGVPAVDAALDRLADLDDTPVDGHVEIFDDVQRRLHDALASLE